MLRTYAVARTGKSNWRFCVLTLPGWKHMANAAVRRTKINLLPMNGAWCKSTGAPHTIHNHSVSTEELMKFFKDNEGRPSPSSCKLRRPHESSKRQTLLLAVPAQTGTAT